MVDATTYPLATDGGSLPLTPLPPATMVSSSNWGARKG